MNIKTKEFNISEDELRHVTSIVYYKQIKIVIIMFTIITVTSVIVAILAPNATNVWFAVGFVILLSYFLALPFIRNPAKTQIKLNFQNRNCEINDNYFSMTYEDGSLSKVHLSNYIKITRESDWYFFVSNEYIF